MPDPTEVAVELDAAHRKAKAAFNRKDLRAYMSLFSADLHYRQSDGKVIDRARLERDIQTQFSRLSAVRTTFDREQFEIADGKAIEILHQTASARATAFFVLHRTWDLTRKGRYVWRPEDGQWVIEEVDVIEEIVQSRGFSMSLRPASLV
ncbi:protein of unknown function [Singulisphaera sp. GP187]|uniref:nuclear transport factor 2 family protein n=1 Tax=Singulisphaera sp. GP187 TaxID=1882752 RepID=UPI00092CB0CB|nr:nuclear transport factor 2 family protein [Singulisphaera sp. GP187]SIO29339.1 protein of unknown function [Singulisphaera sp. GP187]